MDILHIWAVTVSCIELHVVLRTFATDWHIIGKNAVVLQLQHAQFDGEATPLLRLGELIVFTVLVLLKNDNGDYFVLVVYAIPIFTYADVVIVEANLDKVSVSYSANFSVDAVCKIAFASFSYFVCTFLQLYFWLKVNELSRRVELL